MLALLGVHIFRYYVNTFTDVDISFARSCRILLLGFAGCVGFIAVFAIFGAAAGANCEPVLFCLLAFIFGIIGVQSFIYHFMTKSVDGGQITYLHAIILSIIFFIPGVISVIAAMVAMVALNGGV